jgi:tetratricopeptide (TPR) repeat protein
MFTKQQRIIISIVAITIGIFLVLIDDNPVGWLLILMAVFILYGYFRYQPVALLLHHVSKGQLDQADKLLAELKNSATLSPDQRAYYDLAVGWMNMRRGNGATAEQLFTQAIRHGLRTGNDNALAHILLARTYTQQGNLSLARSYLEKAKTFTHNPLVETEIQSLEKELQDV